MNHSHRPRLARAVVAAASGIVLAATMSVPANAAPNEINSTPGSPAQAFGGAALDKQDIKTLQDLKVSGPMVSKKGEVTAYVQFSGEGAFEATQPESVARGKSKPVKNEAKVKQIRKNIKAQGAAAAKASDAEVVYTTTNALPGVALRGDADALRALAKRPDVVKITAIVPKTPTNKGSVVDTKALNAWTALDETGEDVTIAVLDTGVDYTHADFGGPGTVEAYKKAQASDTLPAANTGLRDPAKFIGGWDLVGDDYNADPDSPTYQPVPKPDANPLDCASAGHGTHVSGTAAGYGVDADGKTFDGDYSKLSADDVAGMKIGPGSAPEAQLVGIRVFGCAGSSSVVGQALDYVLDPNNDGDFSDRAQIVNMSLGSDHSPVEDPENDIVDALAEQGILSVVASGNAGDVTDVGGSPGNARSSLTVANTVGSKITLDGAKVLAPTDVAGTAAGQYSVNFDYAAASPEKLTGEVVLADPSNKFGCDAFPAGTDFDGKWVWLQWEEDGAFPCGSAARFNNVQAAGGAGVVLGSPRSVFDAGIAGNSGIPGIQFNKDYTEKLRPAAEAGTLKIQLDQDLIGTASGDSGALDTLNSSSSRGVHGSNGIVKPDVAAPGTLIGSAGVGTGNGPAVMTGTSMATPLTAGIAALVAGSGDYTAYQVKSIVMNTATADVTAANGETFGPNRVGSGRVIADAALKTPAYAYATDAPDLTSLSFGVIEMGKKKVRKTSSITVQNTSKWTQHYRLDYIPATTIPGASYTLSTDKISIRPGKSKQVKVTLTVDPKKFAKTMDPTMDKQQLGLDRQYLADVTGRIELTAKGQPALRVPVQAAPKASSNMAVNKKNIKTKKGKSTAEVKLKGKGLLLGNGDERVLSLVSAFELGATSAKLSKAADEIPGARAMDLKYVGAASDAPSNGVANGLLNIGISTFGNWAHLAGGTEIDVEIDTNGDNKADFVTFNTNVDELDLDLAATFNLKTGEQVDLWPTNGMTGETDSNTFDTSTVSLPVSLAALGLTEGTSGQIQYRVSTWSQYNADESGAQVPVDTTNWIAYNTVDPDLWFEGAGTGTAFADLPGQTLTAHVQDYRNAFPKKMAIAKKKDNQEQGLFLHLHNQTGDKAQVVTFTKR
ncbi:S8 family serine peptidase [Arthrobacter sp. JSM 101049]|uniref:S8 family peptidase n=1 Tax=Arthrobacter sp. JSM 101049 TaxID=929097 RepID=UPI00356636B3